MQENLLNEELENNGTQPTAQAAGESTEKPEAPEPAAAPAISDEDVLDVVFESEPIVAEEHVDAAHDEDGVEKDGKEEEEFFADDLDMESLRAKFFEWVESGEILNSRQNFRKIRDRFQILWDDLRNHAFEAYMAEGGEKDHFEFRAEAEVETFKAKLEEINTRFNELKRRKEQEFQENFLKKQDIIHELTRLIENEPDISKANDVFRELQERWKAIGPVVSQKANDLNQSYRFRSQQFYQSLQIHKELFKIELGKNLQNKERIVKGVESLLKMSSINKALEFLHDYHKQWRETGPVPRAKNDELWQRFKSASDSVYRRRDEHVNRLNEERQKNLETKTGLCEEMETIAAGNYPTLKDFRDADKQVAELDKRWRATGRVPKEFNDSIWERFREARKQFNGKRSPLVQQKEGEFKKNLDDKTRLCERAEALKESTDWKNTTRAFLGLQDEWKKTGPVSRDMSDKIWQRFRAAADHFFNSKDAFFKAIPDREAQNLETKRAVIQKINAYEHPGDVAASFAAMAEFRKEWNAAGFVPIKEKGAVEKEYDEAVKAYFAKINLDPSEKNKIEFKGKLDSFASAPDGLDQIRKERSGIRIRIEKLQEEVNQLETNIRFFGNSKNAAEVTKPYQQKVDRAKAEIKELEEKQIQLRRAAKQIEEAGKKTEE